MSGIRKILFMLLLVMVVEAAALEQMKSKASSSASTHLKDVQVKSDAKSDIEKKVLIEKYGQELKSLQER